MTAGPGRCVSHGQHEQAVGAVMIRDPKTMTTDATVGEVRAVFRNDHVHMVLLTDAGILVGTLVREDVHGASDVDPALPRAVLTDRTIPPTASAEEARRALVASGARRLAVVDGRGVLLGLLCLKRRRTGFCSDRDVRARAVAPAGA